MQTNIITHRMGIQLIDVKDNLEDMNSTIRLLIDRTPNADSNASTLRETWTSIDNALKQLNYAIETMELII
jgi:hypothetical protein